MKPDPDKIEQLLNQALELGPDQRDAFLFGACGSDHQLRKEVETLLHAHGEAEGFLTLTPTAQAAPVPERTGTMIGRYKVLQQIGEGGFGIVYMAEQKEPVKRRVALKIIKLGMDTKQVVARFEAERQALALMDHPNIAKVFDGGATESGRPYFVMELVKGVPITSFCDENNLSTQERLELFTTVCQAIQHAHQKGVIHRDIKPSNILVTLHDGKPVPKVIDFGIAKATQLELTEKTIFTQFQQLIGTPAYMSPEQAEMSGLDIDTRTDIYSLGVLLYELLTGKTPLDAKVLLSGGYDEIRRRIMENEPPRPSTRVSTMADDELTAHAKHRQLDPKRFAAELRGDLDWIVLKALEKDRTRRYESAIGFAHDIRRFLGNEPVAARPPTAIYRFEKMIRRNKVAFVAIGAIATAMLLGLCMATVSLVRERKANTRAVQARAAEEQHRKLAVEQQELAEEQRHRAEQYLYGEDMLLVQQALAESNSGRAVGLLQRYIPADVTNSAVALPGLKVSRDLRGWEWRYFWRQTQSDELPDLSRAADGSSLAFSPDGSLLAISGAESVVLWNVNPRRKCAEFPVTNMVGQVAISGAGLLAAASDYDIRLWDLTRQNTPLPPISCPEQIRAMSFSPAGDTLAVLGLDHFWLWNIPARNATVADMPDGWRLAFSPDGKTLAIAQKMAGQVILWDPVQNVETARMPSAPYEGGWGGSLVFSPDGKLLVAAFGPGTNRTIKVLDVASRTTVTNLASHAAIVYTAVFADHGRMLASCSGDQTIKLWDVATWKLIRTFQGHGHEVFNLTTSPDGTLLASVDINSIKFWKVTSEKVPDTFQPFSKMKATWPAVRAHWALSSDGRSCLTVLSNGTFRVWDTATLQVLTEGPLPCANVTRVAIHSTQLFAFATGEGILHVGKPGSFFSLALSSGAATNIWGRVLPAEVRGMIFSPDGRKLAALNGDLTVSVWDTATKQSVAQFHGPRADCALQSDVAVLAFSPNGQLLAAGSTKSSSLVVFDCTAQRSRWRLPERISDSVNDCAFSPNGQQIATAHADGTVRVWTLGAQDELSNPIAIAFQSGMQMAVAFSPDGKRLATVGGDEPLIKLWDMDTRQEVARLPELLDFFPKVAFLPDGDTLVAASQLELRLWRAVPLSELVNR